jgi:hypothetical protein
VRPATPSPPTSARGTAKSPPTSARGAAKSPPTSARGAAKSPPVSARGAGAKSPATTPAAAAADGAAAPPPPKPSPSKRPSAPAPPALDQRIVEAREALAARRDRVNDIEFSIQSLSYLLKARTATERADAYRAKSTDIMVDVRKMRKEVDALRHADRAVGQLKDTLENMHRHQRMRTAHIRQKRATIVLMDQRATEYAGLRRQMVFDLRDIIKEAHELSRAHERRESFAITVDPWAALASVVGIDGDREDELCAATRRLTALEADHSAAMRAVVAEQRELARAVNRAAEATARDLTELVTAWDAERVTLEQRIVERERSLDEVEHHVHRGTNFTWTSQLQREDLRPLRELKLACDQHAAKLTFVDAEAAALERALADEARSTARSLEELDGALGDAMALEAQRVAENERLREQFRDLQARFPGLMLPGTGAAAAAGASPATAGAAAAASPTRSTRAGASPTRMPAGSPGSAAHGSPVRSPPRRAPGDEAQSEFDGPRFMRPTSSRTATLAVKLDAQSAQAERVREFRSRKPPGRAA